ncbi:MAG TPA: patatin-like phospholipase family protein [Bacteroidales bacterium]|nr:patatin-like phospholipase family protein [Bacteroidales bacterium]
MKEKKYKTGFILSGGGARGFAHLGFIQALKEAGITPDIISGTSAGALVGVLTADGYPPREILKLLNSGSRLDFMRPTLPREGLLQISGIIKILKAHLHATRFEELKIPLYVTATDINNGKAVYFSEGELLDRVIASMSIPVLFQPVVIENIQYLDGGIVDNLPIHPIENQCESLIGSFVNPAGSVPKISGLINIAERAFILSMNQEVTEKADKFDFLVAPPELINYGILDPEKAEELFALGYKATKEKLKNKALLKKLGL